MIKSAIVTGFLGLALAFSPAKAWAEDEEFPEGPAAGDEEELPESDEEEMEEDEVDPLAVLEEVIGRMKDAEQSLSDLGGWKATDAEGKAIETLDQLLTAKELQEKAIREMSKVFDGSKEGQGKAVEGIERLIKAAKEQEGKQGQPKKNEKQEKQNKPQDPKTSKQPNDPAKTPYTPNGSNSDSESRRIAAETDRWGNLPERVRDELSQAEDEFKNSRGDYKARLTDYYRVIGGSD